MDIQEASGIIQLPKNKVIEIINDGLLHPKKGVYIKLKAKKSKDEFYIDEPDLDEFFSIFNEAEPGRHPPVNVRRELLLESNFLCALCKAGGYKLQFHHILAWSKVTHYDTKHMIALCPNCHSKITSENYPDRTTLYRRKEELKNGLQNQNKSIFLDSTNLSDAYVLQGFWSDPKPKIIGSKTIEFEDGNSVEIDEYEESDYPWKIEKTWGDIFKIIVNHNNSTLEKKTIKNKLEKIIATKYNLFPEGDYIIYIDNSTLETILFQFQALGLIERQHESNNTEIGWQLTEIGLETMYKLCAIPKKRENENITN